MELKSKIGTYETQWWFCPEAGMVYFKKDPEFAFTFRDFDRSFYFWMDPDDKHPSDEIQRRYEYQIDGRTFYPDRPAGLISVGGKRMVNVPITKSELAAAA